ncbi:Rieske (2Fe-2S) protein [Actinobacteria bacterium YIM 96077]|uniref:Cytochrome bc1 complex Rieske iron-sulfur subunit n=1 Tax=Phytoactinopolyspora halophila TaxID=1981511 RepID=A0A329QCE4_9ACTN|nr:Rieske (2Fe-2S) protein [Phytoactinopolyspora halophila]AYY13924.1 Rieske (2Fe-2S) protein [Actinobacteria bacterium YIM 96077]RAW10053.1 iron-sulfur protein [Phytoactinopolyspora halophila]
MAMGTVGFGGLVAACGDDEPADEPGGAASPDNATGDASPTDEGDTTPEDGAGETETSDSAEALASVDDVPVGGGVILEGPEIVVTQPEEGEFVAFSNVCTHRGCAVDEAADGLITCPCHGSQFSAVDGSVEQGPAEQALEEISIVVEGDQIRRA